MAKRKVVITGACGYIAQRMLSELDERWELVLLDVRDATSDGSKVPGVFLCDLTNPERDAYREHFRGADAVIHCGFVSPPGMDATNWRQNDDAKFRAEHPNVAMAYNVYKGAHEARGSPSRSALGAPNPGRPRCSPSPSRRSGSIASSRPPGGSTCAGEIEVGCAPGRAVIEL